MRQCLRGCLDRCPSGGVSSGHRWGLGIATAIYLTGALSGAHLNPAVTVSMAPWSDFPRCRVAPYVATQLLGAFAGAAVLYFIFSDALVVFENANHLVRGQTGSEASAMVFGEFFPSPGGHPLTDGARARMSPLAAFGAEVIGTAILLLVIFCTTDARNAARPQVLTAATIGSHYHAADFAAWPDHDGLL